MEQHGAVCIATVRHRIGCQIGITRQDLASEREEVADNRRPKGKGSVYQRADGRWCATLDMGMITGKRRRRTLYGATRTEVERKLDRARYEWETMGRQPASAMTVEAWMRYWLEDVAPRRVRQRTIDTSYRSKIENYIIPLLGKRRLDRLEAHHVREMDAAMAKRGLSGATRRQTYAILLRALTVAQREGKVIRNVAGDIDRPRIERAETKPLTLEEIARILRATKGDPLESRWLAALVLGLRQGEALGLAWSAVDLDAGTLRVERALARLAGDGLVMTEPKSRKSRRTVPIPSTLAASLREHRATESGELVWHRGDGQPIDPRADWQAWTDLLAKAGVRHVPLHDARHAAASVLAALGVHQATTRDILGHSSEALTMHVYTHTDLTALRRALALVDDAYRPIALDPGPVEPGDPV